MPWQIGTRKPMCIHCEPSAAKKSTRYCIRDEFQLLPKDEVQDWFLNRERGFGVSITATLAPRRSRRTKDPYFIREVICRREPKVICLMLNQGFRATGHPLQKSISPRSNEKKIPSPIPTWKRNLIFVLAATSLSESLLKNTDCFRKYDTELYSCYDDKQFGGSAILPTKIVQDYLST